MWVGLHYTEINLADTDSVAILKDEHSEFVITRLFAAYPQY